MDKMLTVLIIFIAMMIIMAAVLAMGAVPTIFQNAEKINQTQDVLNQTLIQQHEDSARAEQKLQIIKEINQSINKSLGSLEERLYQFMNESQKRSENGQLDRKNEHLEMQNLLINQNKLIDDQLKEIRALHNNR